MVEIVFKEKITHRRINNLSKKIVKALSSEKKIILTIRELNGDYSIVFNFLVSVRKTLIDQVRQIDLKIEDEKLKDFIKENKLEKHI